jgi:hypothetical protein
MSVFVIEYSERPPRFSSHLLDTTSSKFNTKVFKDGHNINIFSACLSGVRSSLITGW